MYARDYDGFHTNHKKTSTKSLGSRIHVWKLTICGSIKDGNDKRQLRTHWEAGGIDADDTLNTSLVSSYCSLNFRYSYDGL